MTARRTRTKPFLKLTAKQRQHILDVFTSDVFRSGLALVAATSRGCPEDQAKEYDRRSTEIWNQYTARRDALAVLGIVIEGHEPTETGEQHGRTDHPLPGRTHRTAAL